MSVDIDLRAFLIEELETLPNAANAGVIEYNRIDENGPTTRIWYQRRTEQRDISSAGESLINTIHFDLEVMSLDLDEAQTIAAEVRTLLNGHAGPMGNTNALEVWCADASDEYVSRGQSVDEGMNIIAFDVQILF